MFYPQNGDRIVTTDSMTSLHTTVPVAFGLPFLCTFTNLESNACGVRRAYAIGLTRSVWHRSSIVGSFSTFIVLFIHTVCLPMKEVTSRLGLNGPKIYPKLISSQLLWLNDSRFFDFLPNERRLLLLYAGWAKQVGPQTHDHNSVKC